MARLHNQIVKQVSPVVLWPTTTAIQASVMMGARLAVWPDTSIVSERYSHVNHDRVLPHQTRWQKESNFGGERNSSTFPPPAKRPPQRNHHAVEIPEYQVKRW